MIKDAETVSPSPFAVDEIDVLLRSLLLQYPEGEGRWPQIEEKFALQCGVRKSKQWLKNRAKKLVKKQPPLDGKVENVSCSSSNTVETQSTQSGHATTLESIRGPWDFHALKDFTTRMPQVELLRSSGNAAVEKSPMSVVFLTAALRLTPEISCHAGILADRARAHLVWKNVALALEDASYARMMDPNSAEAAYAYIVSTQAAGNSGEAKRVLAEVRSWGEWREKGFDRLPHQPRIKVDQSAPLRSISVLHGGPTPKKPLDHWLASQFLKASNNMSTMTTAVGSKEGCSGGGPDSEYWTSVRKSTKDLISDALEWSLFIKATGHMEILVEDLSSLLSVPHVLRVSELFHRCGLEWAEPDFCWWFKIMLDQCASPGEWVVSSKEAWKHSTPQWRHDCMERALAKMCSEIEGLEEAFKHCPELSAASLISWANDADAMLKLAAGCTKIIADSFEDVPKSLFLHRLSTAALNFFALDYNSPYRKALRQFHNLAHGNDAQTTQYMDEFFCFRRWEFFSFFAWYSLILSLCRDEALCSVRQKSSQKGKCSYFKVNRKLEQQFSREMAAAKDEHDETYKLDACSWCQAPGAAKKCSTCLTTLSRRVVYCDVACQRRAWEKHKTICGKRLSSFQVERS